ncbi:protein precursor [Phialemonium atrogriseum]|uniref:Protein n=1 Tax=Phialemonium atrogriseum TaxID=1093897 RepID=A0AAJ0C364_9PEZI|nr:protein precursor [Phialemonium atrogriseum]KAK1769299.1 protein precursor [Phialemonium atrogriseum]
MVYLLYSIIFLTLFSGTALYATRAHWLPAFQDLASGLRDSLPTLGSGFGSGAYSRLSSSFRGDMEAGLSSSNFDLGANVESGDSRGGLDAAAKAEILRIMKRRRMRFDEARRVYMEQRFAANGIDADGRPRDPKFVSFS